MDSNEEKIVHWGTELERSEHNRNPDVIGEISVSHAGNTVLRIGEFDDAGRFYRQDRHVVMTPAERRAMIAELTAQEDAYQAGLGAQ